MRPTLPFSQAQMTKILQAASDSRRNGPIPGQGQCAPAARLGCYSAIQGCASAMPRAARFDRLVDGKLRLYTQKTGQHVHCPLPEFVVKELDAMPRTSEQYCFGSGIGDVHDW